MRIVRLGLDRYGHVSGERLEFAPERGLHVVVGANEAGKSTALEALSDALFGFSIKDSRKYRHPDDPRIAFTLRAADGTEASFIRRKKNKDSLLDGAGSPVPETALARFLGGTSRKRFREVFGLDGERLREGGRTILTEHGEAGAAVLQAQTGLRGLREAVLRLDTEAKALFGTKHAERRIRTAADTVKDNRRLILDRSLSAAQYTAAADTEAAATARLDAIQAETARLRATQARLDRTRRTAPVRGAIAQAADQLAQLGPAPDLPLDAADRRRAALDLLQQAERDLTADRGRLASAQGKLGSLISDPAILAEADAIKALDADRTRIASAADDRRELEATTARHRQSLDDTAVRLGVPERGEALRARLPGDPTRRTAERLLKEAATRLGARTVAEESLRAAEAALKQAGCAAAPLASPEPAEALHDAAAAADRAGPIDTALAAAEAELAAASASLAAARAGLPLWTHDLDRLHASPVPLEAEALRLGGALEEAEARLAAAAAALAANDQAADVCRAAIAGLRQAGSLPTADAIADARGRRDTAWRLLRRQIEHGPVPDAADLAVLGPITAAELPNLLDRLLREADDLADRRSSEAIRVREWEALQAEQGRLLALRDGLAAATATAAEAMDAARSAWRAAWAPAGVAPLGPAAMREWVRARHAVLEAVSEQREAARTRDTLLQQRTALADALRSALPGAALPGDAPAADVAGLRQLADRRLKEAASAMAAWDKASADLGRARAQRDEAAERLAGLEAAAVPWAAAWAPIVAKLGLAPHTEPEEAAETLALWSTAQQQLDRWTEAAGRVRQMQDALDQDAAKRAALAGRLGLAASATLVPELSARLATAQADEGERQRLQAETSALASSIADHDHTGAGAHAALAALRRMAAATDDAGLAEAIDRAATRSRLTATIHDRTLELQRLNDGKGEPELAAEAAGTDVDAIPGMLADIEAQLVDLDRERIEHAARRADAKAEQKRMEAGQDVTGPAHAVQDALIDIEQSSGHYVRLRLAHAMLQAGIERFRRGQQGPLLEGASGLFAELTGGRYQRLEQDEDRGEPVLSAVRADGSTCLAGALSDGTRDQLFLALRLASIRLDMASAEPLPFIADDLLVNFDDNRAMAALHLLSRFAQDTQVILFTHHAHLADLADRAGAMLHQLPRELAAAA